eukprot:1156212-Pelagomonas_calceolata.AAC.9
MSRPMRSRTINLFSPLPTFGHQAICLTNCSPKGANSLCLTPHVACHMWLDGPYFTSSFDDVKCDVCELLIA